MCQEPKHRMGGYEYPAVGGHLDSRDDANSVSTAEGCGKTDPPRPRSTAGRSGRNGEADRVYLVSEVQTAKGITRVGLCPLLLESLFMRAAVPANSALPEAARASSSSSRTPTTKGARGRKAAVRTCDAQALDHITQVLGNAYARAPSGNLAPNTRSLGRAKSSARRSSWR